MEQSATWKANGCLAIREIPHFFLSPKICVYKRVSLLSILSHILLVHAQHLTSLRFILVLSCHLCSGLPSVLFPSCFLTRVLHTFLKSPICAKFIQIISYLTKSTNYEASSYAVFSDFLILPLRSKYSLPSVCVLLLMW